MINKYESKRHRSKNKTNQMNRFKDRPNKGGNGFGINSYSWSIHHSIEKSLNVLDLRGVDDTESDNVISERIKETVDNNNFPLKVITHKVVDKVISFKKVIEDFDGLKYMSLDFNNPYTFTVLPK